MIIENSVNEKYIRTLNFGCFPENVLDFQESQDYFQQLIFIEFQLQLIIKNEFGGNELLPVEQLEQEGNETTRKKLNQLVNYANSITANYSTRTYEENLYCSIILAHLFYLNSQLDDMHSVLNLVVVSTQVNFSSDVQNDFVQYLTCKYHILSGLSNVENAYKIWTDYLHSFKKPFKKSQVAANHWLELLYYKLSLALTENGANPLSFLNDLKLQKFFENNISVIGLSNFLIRPENRKLIDRTFKFEYSNFLSDELEVSIVNKTSFPEASSANNELSGFIENLYESLSHVPFNYTVLEPSLSKKFLINSSQKTYQSQTVLSNLIKLLIELNEYDEAFAAFKTYISYLKKDQEQRNGYVDNILSIIDTYSTCIIAFNPLKSFIARNNSTDKFRYTPNDMVVKYLKSCTEELHNYLTILSDFTDLTYDNDELSKNILSFLYHKYNVNVLLSDQSDFIELVSKAWYSLGYYYYYLSTYESPTYDKLEDYTNNVLKFYKNSLIVNSTGNVMYLFNYALTLSYGRLLQPALKLCKFILKKYPESFKTWNLLVLLLTSFETNNPDFIKNKNSTVIMSNGSVNGHENGNVNQNLKESEKFINNALNIAGIFISKHCKNDIKLTVETKFEILQLKLTQLAIWESIYGTSYILEYLTDVFMLYHELFKLEIDNQQHASSSSANDAKWSHRPSFIDPHPSITTANNGSANGISKEKHLVKEKIMKISKINKKDKETNKTLNGKSSKLAKSDDLIGRKILQDVWLWTSTIYLRVGLLEEAEQCIVEAETIYEPNIKTFTNLGLLTSKDRKFLSLQEFERSLEILNNKGHFYNKRDYGNTLLGLSKLFIVDDKIDNSLFISNKDLNAGIIRLKNYLENFSLCWPYGYNNSEVWWFLSKIYELIDDKILLSKSLWKCVELEDFRPVRSFECCGEFNY